MTVHLHIQSYELSFPQALSTAQVKLSTRRGWRVFLSLGERVIGVGEIAPWIGFGSGPAQVKSAVNALLHNPRLIEVLERRASELLLSNEREERIREELSGSHSLDERLTLLSDHLSPALEGLEIPELRCGVEMALLDALAKRLRLPLSSLLNPRSTLSIRTHRLVTNQSEAIEAARRGYRALKIKVGIKDHWVEELMEIARIRAILPEIEIRVDANRSWSAELAYGFCIAAQGFAISWVEEPCREHVEYHALRDRLSSTRHAPLGVDESLSSMEDMMERGAERALEEALSDRLISVLTLKPMMIGGLLKTASIVLRAALAGKRVCITHTLGSCIERSAIAHLAAALKAELPELASGLGGALEGDLSGALPEFGGELRLSTASGLGLEFEMNQLYDHSTTGREYEASDLLWRSPADHERIPHPLVMAAWARPHHHAVTHEGRSTSFSELRVITECLAYHLRQGMRKLNPETDEQVTFDGVTVALQGPLSLAWVSACYALTGLGAVVAPIKPQQTKDERSRSLTLTSAQYLLVLSHEVVSSSSMTLFPVDLGDREIAHHSVNIRVDAEVLRRDSSERLPLQGWSWESPLFVICTSGTTGAPQAIPLCTRQLCISAFGSAIRLGHQHNDQWLACLPPYHVGGLSTILRCALNQITLHVVSAESSAIAEALPLSTLSSLTPTLLSDVCDVLERHPSLAERVAASSLRSILIGGGPTSLALWERAQELSLPLRLTWGMSESASQLCTQLVAAPPLTPLPPLPFADISQDDTSRLHVRGPLLAEGYLQTGDNGQVSDEGIIVYGRSDDQIISGGLNISPIELEETLLSHPLIKGVAVIGVPHERYGERPVAFIEVISHKESAKGLSREREVGELSPSALKAWCRERLSAYKVPDQFLIISELPRSELGKLRRGALKQIYPYRNRSTTEGVTQ